MRKMIRAVIETGRAQADAVERDLAAGKPNPGSDNWPGETTWQVLKSAGREIRRHAQ